jgi:hypothetical protein
LDWVALTTGAKTLRFYKKWKVRCALLSEGLAVALAR